MERCVKQKKIDIRKSKMNKNGDRKIVYSSSYTILLLVSATVRLSNIEFTL